MHSSLKTFVQRPAPLIRAGFTEEQGEWTVRDAVTTRGNLRNLGAMLDGQGSLVSQDERMML